jgi:hypothetical protein
MDTSTVHNDISYVSSKRAFGDKSCLGARGVCIVQKGEPSTDLGFGVFGPDMIKAKGKK